MARVIIAGFRLIPRSDSKPWKSQPQLQITLLPGLHNQVALFFTQIKVRS